MLAYNFRKNRFLCFYNHTNYLYILYNYIFRKNKFKLIINKILLMILDKKKLYFFASS